MRFFLCFLCSARAATKFVLPFCLQFAFNLTGNCIQSVLRMHSECMQMLSFQQFKSRAQSQTAQLSSGGTFSSHFVDIFQEFYL